MAISATAVPLVNYRGQRRSHIRLQATAGEFVAGTLVNQVRSSNGVHFGHKQLTLDPDNGILVLRLTGKHTGRPAFAAPPNGPLTITFQNNTPPPAGPIPVQYVDDPEDTGDDPDAP